MPVSVAEMNEYIRIFMDHSILPYKHMYHLSWDALMIVVSKIETIDSRKYSVHIEKDFCIIKEFNRDMVIVEEASPLVDNAAAKLEATHYAVYKFIRWYEKNNNYKGC